MREIEAYPSTLLSEWMAYHSLYKLPDPYWIGAQVCQVMATVMGTGKKRFKVEDFIPRARPVRIMSGDDGKRMMETVVAMQQAKEAQKSRLSAG